MPICATCGRRLRSPYSAPGTVSRFARSVFVSAVLQLLEGRTRVDQVCAALFVGQRAADSRASDSNEFVDIEGEDFEGACGVRDQQAGISIDARCRQARVVAFEDVRLHSS